MDAQALILLQSTFSMTWLVLKEDGQLNVKHFCLTSFQAIECVVERPPSSTGDCHWPELDDWCSSDAEFSSPYTLGIFLCRTYVRRL